MRNRALRAMRTLALYGLCLLSFITVPAFAEGNAKEAGRAMNASASSQA